MTDKFLEVDYLVIGGGAMSAAFIDALLDRDRSATVAIIERRDRLGGHWNNAYPFVRLHQPAAFYGVNSIKLGKGGSDLSALPEIQEYYRKVTKRFEKSGQVSFYGGHEYLGDNKIAPIADPDNITTFKVNKRLVNGTYMAVEIPSVHPPKFDVADDIPFMPLNDLITQYDKWEQFYVLGCGKTGMDAVLFLLRNGVAGEKIHWVKRLKDFTPEEIADMRKYNAADVDQCYQLLRRLIPQTRRDEVKLIDMTIRMLVEPQFDADTDLLANTYTEEAERKEQVLRDLGDMMWNDPATRAALRILDGFDPTDLGEVKKVLMSAAKFKALLETLGVDVPMKVSPTTGKEIPALSKTDEEFLAMQEHEDDRVAAAASARLDAKGKACADSMRLAIAPAGQNNDPMLLRVPAASLKTLGSYGSQLAKRGVEPQHVVTKIGFDYNVAHPALTFKAVRFVDEAELAEIEQVLIDEDETIGNITGVTGSVASENEGKAEAEQAAAGKRSEKLAAAEEETKVTKKAKVAVEDEPVVAASKPVEPEEVASVDDYDDIDEALENLDFDD